MLTSLDGQCYVIVYLNTEYHVWVVKVLLVLWSLPSLWIFLSHNIIPYSFTAALIPETQLWGVGLCGSWKEKRREEKRREEKREIECRGGYRLNIISFNSITYNWVTQRWKPSEALLLSFTKSAWGDQKMSGCINRAAWPGCQPLTPPASSHRRGRGSLSLTQPPVTGGAEAVSHSPILQSQEGQRQL